MRRDQEWLRRQLHKAVTYQLLNAQPLQYWRKELELRKTVYYPTRSGVALYPRLYPLQNEVESRSGMARNEIRIHGRHQDPQSLP